MPPSLRAACGGDWGLPRQSLPSALTFLWILFVTGSRANAAQQALQALTQTVIDAGFDAKVLHDAPLAVLLEGSAQRRYNLVNRALKSGEWVRLKRGCYVLHPTVTGTKVHGFVVAQHLQPSSFISFETALAWHGWIPEAVRLMDSVVPGRRKAEYSVPLWGDFRFVPLAQLDLICWRKIASEWVPSFFAGFATGAGMVISDSSRCAAAPWAGVSTQTYD